ncbi:MAG: DMT family transporter, partial [Spirochaetales bacterium]|nr:DMT family transporter [Spirochaetales bacterium]
MDQDQSLQRRRALSFLAFGVASFGISGVLIKLCRFPPPVVASFRMILAGAVLAPFCVPAWRRLVSRGGALEVMLLLVPGVLLGLHFHAFVAGLEHTSVASGTFLFSINPVFFALGERFLRRRQVPLHALASLGLVVAGAGWLFVVDHGGLGAALGGSAGRGGSLPGDLLCLLSTLLFVLYLFVSRWVTGTRRALGRRGEGDDGSLAFPVPHHLYIHIVYL